MSTLDTNTHTYTSTQAKASLFFNAGEKGVSSPTKILATKDSAFAKALYGDRLIGDNEPILLNDISAKFIDHCINNRKIAPTKEDAKLLLYRKIIKSMSRKKLRYYLLSSKPESVLALTKIAVKKDLEKLIKTFMKHFQFGLPSVKLTKTLIENPSLFDNLPDQDPPPAFDCDSMEYEDIVKDCTGVDSPTIRLWLNDFSLIAGNLISTCRFDCKVYDDDRNYRELTDLYRLADTEASYYKLELNWQIPHLLITTFAHPEIFSDLHRNCLAMESKNSVVFYIEDIIMYMPHADYLTKAALKISK